MAQDIKSEIFMEEKLLLPHKHLLKVPSKQNRIKIPMAFNHWLEIPNEKVKLILEATNMIHTGSLLFDDIQDNTEVRRTVPAAHLVYGVSITLNASLHVMTLGFQKFLSLNNIMVGPILMENVLENIRGQGKEIYWRENFECPTEEQCCDMMIQKTGHLFNLCICIMQLFSNKKQDYSHLAKHMGLYFQLCDDYWNLARSEAMEEFPSHATEEEKGKHYCQDLTEGKFTVPIIHAAQQKGGEAVLNILRQRTTDINLKKYCVSLLEELGSMQYTREKIRQLQCSIQDEINNLGGNPELSKIINEMSTLI